MSLLSGKEILQAMSDLQEASRRLVVTPLFDRSIQIRDGAASVDLRLGCRFSAAKRRNLTHYAAKGRPPGYLEEYHVPFDRFFVLHPRHFVLATTLEWVRLPGDLGGYILGRSSFGRMGLIIATAAGIHPNYSGVITLELTNLAEVPIEIQPGQAICQLFLHRMERGAVDSADRSAFVGSLLPKLGDRAPDGIETFLEKLK